MAKKKSRKAAKSKKKVEEKREPSLFWRQAWAFLLIVISILVLFGGFGWGGNLPVSLFKFVSWLLGFGAYFLPIVLIYLAIIKFKDDKHVIPFNKIISSTFTMAVLAGMLHVFVDSTQAATYANEGRYGGMVGYGLSKSSLQFFNSSTSFIVFVSLLLVGALFTFSITPKAFFEALMRLIRRQPKEGEVTDLKQLKDKAKPEFTMNAGVPVEHRSEAEAEPQKRLSNFKNTVKADERAGDQEALTLSSETDWQLPPLSLLNKSQDKADPGDVQANADTIRETLANFNIDVQVEGANIGPRVTQFSLKPPSGTKLAKITALESNIALDLAAQAIRIEAPIPGKKAVGIEVPHRKSATVRLSSILGSKEWKDLGHGGLNFAVGKDISGKPIVGRIEKMPHLLIAGQTGSGKSVMINSLLASLLYTTTPSELKLILVDPKQVELTPFNDIPHLLTPVITEPEKCISALKWAVAEMDRRLKTFSSVHKRNIVEYNSINKDNHMPYIVIVIDELADLMMMAARDVEALVVRIAQKARAAGIHLVLATQRPSVDIITGLIKANVPARIAFTTVSQVDSRTIIDTPGSEKLLGQGDMLFLTSDMAKPVRIQGAYIDDAEIAAVTEFLREQREPQYDDEVVSQIVQFNGRGGVIVPHDSGGDVDDDMWQDSIRVVIEAGKASTSLLQRRLRIGYGRAARIMETMEEQSIVGPANGSRPREVLVSSLDQVLGNDDGSTDIEIAVEDEPEPLE